MPVSEFMVPLQESSFYFKGIFQGYVFSFHLSSSFSEFVRPLRLNDGQLMVVVKIREARQHDGHALSLTMISPEELSSDEERHVIDHVRWELGLTEDTTNFHQRFGRYFPRLPLGYRVTQTPLEEILLTSLLSQNASMNLYALQAAQLARLLGPKLTDPRSGETYAFFPTWEEIAKASKETLLACKLGYRVKYLSFLLETWQAIRENDLLAKWRTASTEEIITALTKTRGLGQYSAAAIALYGLGRKDAFFSDAYLRKLLESILKKEKVAIPSSKSMKAWRTHLNELWDGHAGWMVDFLTANAMVNLGITENPHFFIAKHLVD